MDCKKLLLGLLAAFPDLELTDLQSALDELAKDPSATKAARAKKRTQYAGSTRSAGTAQLVERARARDVVQRAMGIAPPARSGSPTDRAFPTMTEIRRRQAERARRA